MSYELVDTAKLNACLTAEANTIREKTGSIAQLEYDFVNEKGFSDAIANIGGEEYEGDYTVAPRVATNIILPTTGKSLSNDITVFEIPIYVVANQSGGNTIIIGDD